VSSNAQQSNTRYTANRRSVLATATALAGVATAPAFAFRHQSPATGALPAEIGTMSMTAENRLAVIDLIADYAWQLERGNLEAYVENFMPDGVFQGGDMQHEGRDAIRTFVAHLIEIGQDGPDGHRHLLGIPWIRGNDERCEARTLFWIPGEPEEFGVRVRSVGEYQDEIVKWNGRWHFARRHLTMFLTAIPST